MRPLGIPTELSVCKKIRGPLAESPVESYYPVEPVFRFVAIVS